MRIFLCGMMGAGKSTIGKKLSFKFQLPFIDLDRYIELNENKSISRLFEEYGEDYFRRLEKKYLEQVINNNESCVVSLGGGTPCFYNNMQLINSSGRSVFINLDINKLTNRLWYAKTKRPLTKNIQSPDALRTFIEQKLNERLQYYTQCHYTIDGTDESLLSLVKTLEQK
jgi:shikimate kinase